MKLKKIDRNLLLCLAVFTTISCIKESSLNHTETTDSRNTYESSYNDGTEILSAVYACNEGKPSTRTIRQDDGSIFWRPGDKISVFPNGSGSHGEFTATNTKDTSWTVFSGEMTIQTVIGGTENSDATSYNYAVYPYDVSTTRKDDFITAAVPSIQTAVSGSFDPASYFSIGRSESFNFKFYNLCGGVKFSVKTPGIKRITFKGNNDETLAGKVVIAIDTENHPYVLSTIDGKSEITLNAPGGSPFATGEWYYMAMLPTSLPNGFTITFTTDSSEGTRIVTANNTIKRSSFTRFTELDNTVQYVNTLPKVQQAFIASDRHANSNNGGKSIMTPILQYMKNTLNADVTHAFLVGDMVGYGYSGSSTYSPAYYTSEIKKEVTDVYKDAEVIQVYGNHDAGYKDDAGTMKTTCVPIDCGSYFVYTVPQPYLMKSNESECGSNEFKAWANQQDPSKPIFVMSHLPLHAKRGDNLSGYFWHKALNEVATGSTNGTVPVRNIIFVLAHNHSQDNGTEFTNLVGDKLEIQGATAVPSSGWWPQTSSYETFKNQTIYYNYWVAGYLNDRKHGTLMTIDESTITLSRYKSGGPAENGGNDGAHNIVIQRIK